MKTVLHFKGEKGICKNCEAHIFTLSRDIHPGDAISEAIMEEKEGQGPWRIYERTLCRSCNFPFFTGSYFTCKMERATK